MEPEQGIEEQKPINIGSRVRAEDGFEGTVYAFNQNNPGLALVEADAVNGRREGRWLAVDTLTNITTPAPVGELYEEPAPTNGGGAEEQAPADANANANVADANTAAAIDPDAVAERPEEDQT